MYSLNIPDLFGIYLLINAAIGGAAATFAKKKGFKGGPTFALTTLAGTVSFGLLGLISLIVFWLRDEKHYYCKHCGAKNYHALTQCYACGHTLDKDNKSNQTESTDNAS